MGEKGAKTTTKTDASAEAALNKLQSLGDVTLKKMFGGYGLFESKVMFALVSPKGGLYFKVDDSNRDQYEQADSPQHMRMPYFQVPDNVWAEEELLRQWAKQSIIIAHAGKK